MVPTLVRVKAVVDSINMLGCFRPNMPCLPVRVLFSIVEDNYGCQRVGRGRVPDDFITSLSVSSRKAVISDWCQYLCSPETTHRNTLIGLAPCGLGIVAPNGMPGARLTYRTSYRNGIRKEKYWINTTHLCSSWTSSNTTSHGRHIS